MTEAGMTGQAVQTTQEEAAGEEDSSRLDTSVDSTDGTSSVSSGGESNLPSPVAAVSSGIGARRVYFASPIARIQLVEQFTPSSAAGSMPARAEPWFWF